MKKTQITLALNALALAGMLVFAAQTANAAPSPSADLPEAQNSSIDVTSPDTAEVNDIDTTEVADVDVQEVESVDTPDMGEIDSVSEIESEAPDGPESN
jgi:hypothetical protein